MDEAAAAFAQGHARDEDVNVGMVEHPPAPGLEDGDEARLTAEMPGVAAELTQPLRTGFEQEIIQFARVTQAVGAQLRRDGDGD
jgi:hypothetical protein